MKANKTFTSLDWFYSYIGIIYLIAYISLYSQFHGLVGINGIFPNSIYIEHIRNHYSSTHSNILDLFLKSGNIIAISNDLGFSTDTISELLLWSGMISSSFLSCGIKRPIFYMISWISYVSLIHTGYVFLSFQWDILLSEIGFLCFLTSIFFSTNKYENSIAFWPFRFLAFKLMFLSGVVKLQSKCPTWENLTALEYHFASQCIPTPIAWYFHQLPPIILRLGVAFTLVLEIPLSFLLIVPFSYIRKFGGILQICFQVLILLTGNYTFFNLLTIILMIPSIASDFQSTNDLITLSSYNIFAKYLKILYWFDGTTKGRKVQYLVCLVFMGMSIYFMFKVDFSLFDYEYWWNGNIIKLEMKWESLIPYLAPTVLLSIALSCSHLIIHSLTFFFNSSNLIFPKRNYGIRSICFLWKLIGSFIMILWILLSASHFDSICNVNSYIPQFIFSFRRVVDPFFVVSSYGLFRQMTGVGKGYHRSPIKLSTTSRPEIILQGLGNESSSWIDIPFLYKPTEVSRSPPFVAPYQPRLDWQMWFVPFSSYERSPWLILFMNKLLYHNDIQENHEVFHLLDYDNYPFKKPIKLLAIRAIKYDYDFTRINSSWSDPDSILYNSLFDQHVNHSSWWVRKNAHEYIPSLEIDNPSLRQFVENMGIRSSKTYISQEQEFKSCNKKSLANKFLKLFPNYFPKEYSISIHKQICKIHLIPRNYSSKYDKLFIKISISIIAIIMTFRFFII